MKRLFFALLCVVLSLAGCKKSDDGVFTDKFTGTVWSGVTDVSAVTYEFSFHEGNKCTYTVTTDAASQPQTAEATYRYNATYGFISLSDAAGDVIGIAYIRDEAKMFMDFSDDGQEDVVLLKQ